VSIDSQPFYPLRNAEAGLSEDQRRFLENAEVSRGLPSLFYGTLRNPRVFEAVTGRPLDKCEWEEASIRGFRPGIVNAGTGYPGIFPAPDQAGLDVECIIVHDLSRFEQTMVAWYEWDEYRLRAIRLTDGRQAQVFVPDLEAIQREYGPCRVEPCRFDAWRDQQVNQAIATARAWMAQRPAISELADVGLSTPPAFPGDTPKAS
jgi:hypothetical protein